jgi:hypothetical protein
MAASAARAASTARGSIASSFGGRTPMRKPANGFRMRSSTSISTGSPARISIVASCSAEA